MLVDIVKHIIAQEDDIDVVGELAGQEGLLDAAKMADADIILLSTAAVRDAGDYDQLLYQWPRLKILAITADGRYGFLHKLMPEVMPLGEVSPGVLVDAIRGCSPAEDRRAGHG